MPGSNLHEQSAFCLSSTRGVQAPVQHLKGFGQRQGAGLCAYECIHGHKNMGMHKKNKQAAVGVYMYVLMCVILCAYVCLYGCVCAYAFV